MAKKYLNGFGKTPKVAVHFSDTQLEILSKDDWFIEYKNTNTRNAIAQGLKLVDHDGDSIPYQGEPIDGFKVSWRDTLFLLRSRLNGAYQFDAYHKKPSDKDWHKWQMNAKPPKAILTRHTRNGKLTRGE